MAITPTKPLNLPLSGLRRMVSLSPTFQSRAEASGRTLEERALSSLHRIHYENIPAANARWPLAIVGFGDTYICERTAVGEANFLSDSGTLSLSLEDLTPASYAEDCGLAMLDFTNWVGGVLEDILALSGVEDHLSITRIEVGRPQRSYPEKGRDLDFHYVDIKIHWSMI